MNTARWQELRAKTQSSYVARIDLRELDALLQAARDLRVLVDAIRELAPSLAVRDEGNRLLALVDGVAVLEGPLPCS